MREARARSITQVTHSSPFRTHTCAGELSARATSRGGSPGRQTTSRPRTTSRFLGGVTYPLFYGWTDEFDWEPEGRRGVTRLRCVDLLGWLDKIKPVIAATGPTTTGAAIGKILDYAGWTEPGSRSLAVGDSIPDFTADGSKTGLELVKELLEAEQGILYVSGASKAVYESRHSRAARTSVATITDQMRHVAPGVDFKRVRNVVKVVRTQNGYTATATDAVSIDRVGERAHPTITTPYLGSDTQADGLAAHVLAKVVRPRAPLRAFEIDNRTTALLTQVLARELLDRVTLSEAEGGSTGDWHIEKVRHEIETGRRYRHSARWLLSEATAQAPFQIGVSLISAAGATSGPGLTY